MHRASAAHVFRRYHMQISFFGSIRQICRILENNWLFAFCSSISSNFSSKLIETDSGESARNKLSISLSHDSQEFSFQYINVSYLSLLKGRCNSFDFTLFLLMLGRIKLVVSLLHYLLTIFERSMASVSNGL